MTTLKAIVLSSITILTSFITGSVIASVAQYGCGNNYNNIYNYYYPSNYCTSYNLEAIGFFLILFSHVCVLKF